jgi:hypothetical protein
VDSGGFNMSNINQDLYTQIAEEFNVERAFVKVIAYEVAYSPNPLGEKYDDRVRARVKHALDLIDKSEE